jgi:D-alanyl-lipoteichoic acid acyltransferase DltB (MBOAT superfamily)
MVFNSFEFAVFFVAVFALYLLTMRRVRVQNAILLAASYVFYGWWDWRFLGLLAFSTFVDFALALLMDRGGPDGRVALSPVDSHEAAPRPAEGTIERGRGHNRCLLLWTSVGVNLGVLGFFKYFDFFTESAAAFLTQLGLSTEPRRLNLILPVGISFYTFQSLSYTIDVYRGQLRAVRDPIAFALYVSFFPQLVAGPIVRAAEFLPQVSRRRHLSLDQTYEGAYLILWGLFKKAVIADNLAPLVDRAFANGATPSGAAILTAVYAFAVQIYCDFSGYSDIARGCGKWMGFELPVNFHHPYLARNPAEFWRRWHISLSTWLRDYLYIPLGGNRKGSARTSANLMLTMILGGLWHGAAWTFVVWGTYQGVLLVGHRLVRALLPAREPPVSGAPRWGTILARAAVTFVCFHLMCLGWLIFRAESMGQAQEMIQAIVTQILDGRLFVLLATTPVGLGTLLAYCLPLIFLEWIEHRGAELPAVFRLPVWIRGCSYAMLFYGLIFFGGHVDKPFIYFQF